MRKFNDVLNSIDDVIPLKAFYSAIKKHNRKLTINYRNNYDLSFALIGKKSNTKPKIRNQIIA